MPSPTKLQNLTLIGEGPAAFSTSLELQRFPPVIWDTNGYYRDLGVDPYAVRKELMRAYEERDGQSSTRLTYVLKQLLDPNIRRRYDRTPLGSVFMDLYVLEAMERIRVQEATKAIREGRATVEETQREESVYEKLREVQERQRRPIGDEGKLDPTLSKPHNRRNLSHPSRRLWPYAFYVWETFRMDPDGMAEWQGLLCSVLGGRKEVFELAVGFHGFEEPVKVSRVGYRTVVFLADSEEPSVEVAEQAASILTVTGDDPSGSARGDKKIYG